MAIEHPEEMDIGVALDDSPDTVAVLVFLVGGFGVVATLGKDSIGQPDVVRRNIGNFKERIVGILAREDDGILLVTVIRRLWVSSTALPLDAPHYPTEIQELKKDLSRVHQVLDERAETKLGMKTETE